MDERSVPIKAAKVSFDVIEALREREGAGVSELATALEMPTSTIHDHLRTLEQQGYLVKEDGEYRVGARFLELGEQARSRKKVYGIARPEVDSLAEETGEHANLLIEEHGLGVFLYKARGEDAVNLDTHAGMRVLLQTTALGKTILAYRPREEVEAILDEHGLPEITANTVTDRDELLDELETIRERDYSINRGEHFPGVAAIGTAIVSEPDDAIGAISISGPLSRMGPERVEEDLAPALMNKKNIIELKLKRAE